MKNYKYPLDSYITVGLLSVLTFTPLLIGTSERTFHSPFITTVPQLAGGLQLEFFTTYKMWFIFSMTLILLTMFIWRQKQFHLMIYWQPIHFSLLVFLIICFISAACSSYSFVALFGQFNRAEGAIMYSCYFLLFFIASQISLRNNIVKKVAIACSPMLIINVTFLTIESIGVNILNLPIINQLLHIPELYTLNKNPSFYGTLNQLNYLSAMFAMLSIFYIFYSFQQRHWTVYAAIILSIYGLLLSVSNVGFFTFMIILIFAIGLSCIKKRWLYCVKLVGFIFLYCIMAFVLSFANEEIALESISFYKNPEIQPNLVEEKLIEPLAATSYEEFTLPILPTKNQTALSSREYIWEKTLHIIQERPLIGYGLDTFIYEFPHFNIDARSGISTENLIVDKPHNFYLGILFGTGTLGFIAFCTILFIIFYVIFKKRDIHMLPLIGTASAYLLCGLTIDSTLALSAMFWIFLGLCMNVQKDRQSSAR